MLETLRHRDFALLWCAGLISQIGNWVLITAIPFYVYERTDSTLASGVIWLAYALPALLVGSVAGVYVDRWERRRTMVVVNLLQCLLLLGLPLARSDGWLWLAFVVVFLEATLAQFFGPAENALLPRLVEQDRLLTANALNSLNDNLARIVGPTIGGLVVAGAGLTGAALVDAASFLAAAALIALIRSPANAADGASPDAHLAGERAADDRRSVWREWAAGVRLVRTDRLLRGVFFVGGVAALADSILTALLVPFVDRVVERGAQAFGVILAVRGVAGLIGGAVVGRWGHRLPPGRLLGGSLVAIGVGVAIEVNVPVVPLILAITLALGPPVVGWLTSQQALLQAGTVDQYRGRVFGAFGTSNALMFILGAGLASVLGDAVGIVPLLNASALLYAGAGLLGLALLPFATTNGRDEAPPRGPVAPDCSDTPRVLPSSAKQDGFSWPGKRPETRAASRRWAHPRRVRRPFPSRRRVPPLRLPSSRSPTRRAASAKPPPP